MRKKASNVKKLKEELKEYGIIFEPISEIVMIPIGKIERYMPRVVIKPDGTKVYLKAEEEKPKKKAMHGGESS